MTSELDLFGGLDSFGNGPNAATLAHAGDRHREFSFFAQRSESWDPAPAEAARLFMESLKIPEGPNAGKPVSLAPFQAQFIDGAMAPDTASAVLSIGRGNGKSAITAGLALGGLIGIWDRQRRREIVAAARTRDQGRIIWDFVAGFAASLPLELQRRLIYRRAPRLEIEFEGDGGGHVLRVIAADGKSALGGAPTMAILDERGHWALDRGDELEHALLSGLGKRGGRAFLISTSASDDTHPFSRWIDETRFRAALISEDTERRDAGTELETRSAQEWANLMAGFEMRQVALALDEGRQLEGQTAEIVTELREQGGFRGVPVPWQALEVRAGETVASGTPDPVQTRPIIDRLFPGSVAARMGAQMIAIDTGVVEWPVTTSAVSAGWADSELANVAGPTAFTTADRAMSPDHSLGVQMRITRKTLKQSGAALEQAVRRDMNGAMAQSMDKAVFLGTGADGQPLGVIAGAGVYGITSTAVSALADWGAFRAGVTRFMTANAATGPKSVRALIRPEVWDYLDSRLVGDGGFRFEYDRLAEALGEVVMTSNALDAPTGDPLEVSALLTTSTGGVAPIFVGAWGAVDMIRDPYSDAQSGGLRITALATMDVTVARPAQLEVLTELQIAGA